MTCPVDLGTFFPQPVGTPVMVDIAIDSVTDSQFLALILDFDTITSRVERRLLSDLSFVSSVSLGVEVDILIGDDGAGGLLYVTNLTYDAINDVFTGDFVRRTAGGSTSTLWSSPNVLVGYDPDNTRIINVAIDQTSPYATTITEITVGGTVTTLATFNSDGAKSGAGNPTITPDGAIWFNLQDPAHPVGNGWTARWTPGGGYTSAVFPVPVHLAGQPDSTVIIETGGLSGGSYLHLDSSFSTLNTECSDWGSAGGSGWSNNVGTTKLVGFLSASPPHVLLWPPPPTGGWSIDEIRF